MAARNPRNTTGRAAGIVTFFVGLAVLLDFLRVVGILTGRSIAGLLTGDRTAVLPLEELPQVSTARLADGLWADITDLKFTGRLLCASPILVHLVVVLLAGLLLAGIIRRIGAGDAFAPTVRRSWARVGGILVVGGIVQGLLDTAAVVMIHGLTAFDEPELGAEYAAIGVEAPDWPWLLILMGVVAGALAVAFTQGARLEEDVAGVV